MPARVSHIAFTSEVNFDWNALFRRFIDPERLFRNYYRTKMTSSEEDSEYGMVNTDKMVIRPYLYEPLPRERRVSEDKSSSNDDDEEDLNIERISNTDWCDCGHCVSMPKSVECLCCREVALTLQKANEANCGCITQVDGFTPVCLNPDVVVTAIYQYIEDEQFIDDHPTSEYVFVFD
eukprot:gene11107-19977_t